MAEVKTYRITTDNISCVDRPDSLSDRTALHEAIEIKCFYEGSATLLIESRTISVKAGDVVQMGDAIGTVANTALLETAQGDHLHFSVTLNDEPIDPVKFLEME